jgi:hypothetical protein
MPVTIQYYLRTYSSILQRDCPVHLSPLTSCTHFLYVFDTFSFAVTHNNRTTLAQYIGLNSNGFQRRYKKLRTLLQYISVWMPHNYSSILTSETYIHRTRYLNFKCNHVHQRFPYRSFPHLFTHPRFISCHNCMTKFPFRPARY